MNKVSEIGASTVEQLADTALRRKTAAADSKDSGLNHFVLRKDRRIRAIESSIPSAVDSEYRAAAAVDTEKDKPRSFNGLHELDDVSAVPARFPDTLRRPAIASRWLLVLAETVETIVALHWERPERLPHYILLSLFIYNLASLFVVHRVALKKLPIAFFMGIDIVWLALAAAVSGMSASPFIGQFFLIIFASSLFFGATGGVVTGIAAAAATSLLALAGMPPRIEDVQVYVPYFLISGAFSGYLVDRLNSTLVENERAKAVEREITLQAEATRHELELARIMQEAALPKAPIDGPELDVASEWEFAHEVGGDFHLFLVNDRQVGMVVGDVSGKGIPAALAATTIGHLIPWLNPLQDAHKALVNLNLDLVRRLPREAFATLQLAIVDKSTGVLHLWNAGHPPAVLCRSSVHKSFVLEQFNPLLGVLSAWDGQQQTIDLLPGDVVVLYSDGLLEARNSARQMFGLDQINAVLGTCGGKSAAEIAWALRTSVAEWGTVEDDLTIVVFKYIGPRPDSESNS